MTEKKMSASRKHTIKSMMLQLAKTLLDQEATKKAEERKRYLEEKCPPLYLPNSLQGLQGERTLELCMEFNEKIDVIDDERYDLERKVALVCMEVADMKFKIFDLKGKFKKPPLKKVRMSADAMLQALLGSKHKVTLDLRSNLKQVKKEVKEDNKDLRDVGDWRKNIEDKAGMGGRKKMFEAES